MIGKIVGFFTSDSVIRKGLSLFVALVATCVFLLLFFFMFVFFNDRFSILVSYMVALGLSWQFVAFSGVLCGFLFSPLKNKEGYFAGFGLATGISVFLLTLVTDYCKSDYRDIFSDYSIIPNFIIFRMTLISLAWVSVGIFLLLFMAGVIVGKNFQKILDVIPWPARFRWKINDLVAYSTQIEPPFHRKLTHHSTAN